MVQIIQSGPSTATLRQQALDQAMGNIVGGLSAYDAQKKQEAQTLRQQALQEQAIAREDLRAEMAFNQAAAEKGLGISYEDAKAFAEGKYQPKEITPAQAAIPAQFGKELPGPVQPGQGSLRELIAPAQEAKPAVMGPANPYQSYTERKRQQAEQEAQAKKVELELKSAQAQDFYSTAPLKKQKYEAEIYKIQQDANMSPLKKRALIAQIQKDEAAAAKSKYETSATTPAQTKLAKLGGETQSKVGAIASGLKALKGLNVAVKSGVDADYLDANTPIIGGLFSDNSFTRNQRVVDEVIGRLQSGGAIGVEEIKTFRSLGPRPGDSAAEQKRKLQDQRSFLENKLTAFGFKESDLQELGFDVGGVEKKKESPLIDHPEVDQAAQWAQQNPNDPRAREILNRIGG